MTMPIFSPPNGVPACVGLYANASTAAIEVQVEFNGAFLALGSIAPKSALPARVCAPQMAMAGILSNLSPVMAETISLLESMNNGQLPPGTIVLCAVINSATWSSSGINGDASLDARFVCMTPSRCAFTADPDFGTFFLPFA